MNSANIAKSAAEALHTDDLIWTDQCNAAQAKQRMAEIIDQTYQPLQEEHDDALAELKVLRTEVAELRQQIKELKGPQ